MLRDRDRVDGGDFVRRGKAIGRDTLLTPYRAPKANASAERVVRTLRNECLDHVLILANEQHLRLVLQEYLISYNADRPHRSVALEPALPTGRDPATRGARGAGGARGESRTRSVLGGLHHVYARPA